MKIAHTGKVRKIYKDATGFWCVEIKRTHTETRGITRYIGFKTKPKIKEGDRIYSGQEI